MIFIKSFKRLFEDVPVKINVLNILFVIVWTILDGSFTMLLSNLVANAIGKESDLLKASIFFILYILGWELLEYVSDCYMHISSTYIENNAFQSSFDELYTTKPEVLKKINTGYIAGILNKLVNRKTNAYTEVTVSFFIGFGYTLYVILYLFKFSWIFSLIVFVLSVFGILIRIVGNTIVKKRVEKMREVEASRTKLFMDTVTNISTVQKLRSKNFSDNKMNAINIECLDASKKWIMLEEIFFCGCKIVMYLVAPICFIALQLMNNVNFDALALLSFITMAELQLVHTTKGIARAVKYYGLYRQQQLKMDEIIKHQSDVYTNTSIGSDFKKIEIKNVDYSYVRDDNKKSVTVHIPHFEFNKGDFVCISGESGQGKTTTLNILSGALESNNVSVDGVIANKNIDAVYVAQDVEMFDMSLRDNLTLGSDIPDEELVELISAVGLGDWYDNQPYGLDTILGERGVFVSTGQRQRLNLIRGLLIQNKEIYLLDEPTSNVDSKTEEKMIKLIKEKLINKTVIIVTHRDKIKEICNRHYKFVDGTIHEQMSQGY